MKTKLLKLTLSALALLPMGAWADIDFGTEATVSTTKTWVFDDLTGSPWSATTCVNSEYYLRAQSTNSRTVTLTDLGSSETLTFCDGTTTTVKKYLAITKTNNSPTNGMTANSSSADGDSKIYATGTFAFNADVAGTLYVKIKGNSSDVLRIFFSNGTNVTTNSFTATSNIDEIAYTSTEKGTFFIGDVTSNFQIYAVRFVPSSVAKTAIGATHEWTFDKKLLGVTSVVYAGDGLYLRGNGSTGSTTAIGGSTRTLSISTKGGEDPSSETLGEEDVTITNVVTTYKGIEAPNSDTKDAGSISSNKATPMLAVKTSVPGTLYAAVRPVADGSGTSRIYFTDGTADPANVSSGQITLSSASTTYKPYAHTKSSGTFFIGATEACKIYAVRFVPESVTAPTIKNNNGTITITHGVSSVGATVKTYYTTDGSIPTSSSTEYTVPFSQTTAATIKAITISESSASTASELATKGVPAIPTALSSNSISFAGLTSSDVTMDDADNFETTDPYKTKTSSATALYIKDVIFCYTQDNRTITLNPNYVIFSGAPMTITIPGLTAGDIVAISSSSNNTDAVTFACSSGGTLISGDTNSKQTTPTNVYFQSTGGNMVLTITNAGLRLYGINVTDGVALTEANGLTPFKGIKNTTVKASFSRTFTSSVASTVVLPFDYTPSTEGTYYTFTGVNEENSTVYMTSTESSLTAGTPYLFMPSTTAVTFSNNAYTVPAGGFTAEGTTTNGDWHFKGTYEGLTWSDGQTVLYGLAASDFMPTSGSVNVGDFVRFNSGSTAAFRAYMYKGSTPPTAGARDLDGTNPSLPERMKVVLIGPNGGATTIGTIPVVYEDSDWYTLDGRRLIGKPTQKGLYINNGRKVIIK